MKCCIMRYMAVAVLAGALSLPAISITNGDMSDGYVDAAGDTMPLGWGNTAVKGGCRAYYDQVDFVSGPASFKVIASDTCVTSYVAGFQLTQDDWGQEFIFTGWVKHANINNFQLATIRFCGGGGYRELPGGWSSAYRSSGSSDWIDFEQRRTVPTPQECDDAGFGGIRNPNISVHIHPNNSGAFPGSEATVNIDDLAVVLAGVKINLATGERIKLAPIEASGSILRFESTADYTCAIHTPQGRLLTTVSGSAQTVDLRSAISAPGAYVVRITSSVGDAVKTLRIDR